MFSGQASIYGRTMKRFFILTIAKLVFANRQLKGWPNNNRLYINLFALACMFVFVVDFLLIFFRIVFAVSVLFGKCIFFLCCPQRRLFGVATIFDLNSYHQQIVYLRFGARQQLFMGINICYIAVVVEV